MRVTGSIRVWPEAGILRSQVAGSLGRSPDQGEAGARQRENAELKCSCKWTMNLMNQLLLQGQLSSADGKITEDHE